VPELIFRDLSRGATYGIPDDLAKLLFNRIQSTPPVDLLAIRGSQEPTTTSSRPSQIIEKESVARLSAPSSKAKASANLSEPNHSQGTTPFLITGDFLEKIEAERPRLDAAKGSCVARRK
jgi:hypothetical protein